MSEELNQPTSLGTTPELAAINRRTMLGEIKSTDEWLEELAAAGVTITDSVRAEVEAMVKRAKGE